MLHVVSYDGAKSARADAETLVLAKIRRRPVFRVELAGVVSKYLAESEKHLARVLELGEHAEVVLVYDESDALFGRRASRAHLHDRVANAAKLLRRLEQMRTVKRWRVHGTRLYRVRSTRGQRLRARRKPS